MRYLELTSRSTKNQLCRGCMEQYAATLCKQRNIIPLLAFIIYMELRSSLGIMYGTIMRHYS